ncbi:ABC transporter permease [Radicibacter daui]|uniref:ABC transporter permease n=1 Tax=Radicibacter daui TaxID=3064829 RepID=UPI004046F361
MSHKKVPLLRLEPRAETARVMVYAAPLIAVVLTLIGGSVLFALMGFAPHVALYNFFIAPISDTYGLSELAVKATPLVLIAIGLSLGFRANVWNIGAEGQLTIGALFGGMVALALNDLTGWYILPLEIIAGVLAGMAWAAIPAFLRTRFNTNEILVSLMLTYIAQLLLNLLVHGVLRDPAALGFPQSKAFSDSTLLPTILDGTRVTSSTIITLLIVGIAWVVVAKSFVGFQIRVAGLAPAAARYAGFRQPRLVWMTLLAGGGLAGLAGIFEVAGPIGQLQPTISPGYGFTAIIVAFLGRLHPLGILLAGLLVALSYLGGEAVQINMGMPLAVTGVFQGMLLFFLLACDVLVSYRIRWRGTGQGAVTGARAAKG